MYFREILEFYLLIIYFKCVSDLYLWSLVSSWLWVWYDENFILKFEIWLKMTTRGQKFFYSKRPQDTKFTPKVSILNFELEFMTFYTRYTLTIISSYQYQCSSTGFIIVGDLWCSINCDSTQSQLWQSSNFGGFRLFWFFDDFRWTTKFEFFRLATTFFGAPRKNLNRK